jgi:hypothetical protein
MDFVGVGNGGWNDNSDGNFGLFGGFLHKQKEWGIIYQSMG